LTLVAALGSAAAIAGCGTTTVTENPAASDSAAAGAIAGTTTTTASSGAFNPALVQTTTTSTTPATTSKHATAHKAAKKAAAKPKPKPKPKAATKTTATTTTTPTTTTPAASTGSGGGVQTVTVTVPAPTTTTPSQTTPAKTGNPDAPFPMSTLPIQHFTAFTTPGNNIGCQLGNGSVRCDISSRYWSAPKEPKSCRLAWGQGLTFGAIGGAHFVCAADSVLDPAGQVVQNEYDDSVDGDTCQVRTVGVVCFVDATRHGFWLSRLGYKIF
jgi:hypothetical protein